MDFTKIDFSQAYIRHTMFKTRLRAYLLTGSGDTNALTSSEKCSLGVWLSEVVVKYSVTTSTVMEVSYLHEEVHSAAAKLIRLFSEDRVDEAREGLSRIEQMDQDLLTALNTLEREVAA